MKHTDSFEVFLKKKKQEEEKIKLIGTKGKIFG
jgi:hypothetical protein